MTTTAEAIQTALAHHRAGRLRDAERIYRQVLNDEPRNADALHLIGLVAFQSGDSQAAEKFISRAIQLDGGRAAFHMNLGEVLRATGRLDAARASYTQAVRLNPNLAEAQNNLGTILQSQGHAAEAMVCYRKAIDVVPNYADAHNNLGTAYQDLGDWESAIAAYRRAAEVAPDYAGSYYNLGLALKTLGRPDEAQPALERAIALRESYVEARFVLATILQDKQQWVEAEAELRRALQFQPKFVDAWNSLGMLAQAQGKFAEAILHYTEALDVRPDYAPAHYNWGVALAAEKRFDEAETKYRRAITCKPDFVEAHFNLGRVLQELNRLEDAAAAYRDALRWRPDYATAHNNLGNVYYALGKSSEAIDSFRKALSINPEYSEALNNLGNVLQAEGDSGAAVEMYERCLRLSPEFPEVHHNLSLLYLGQERFEEAWPEYVWRLKCAAVPVRPFSQPLWRGEPLEGRTLLIHAEQGLGDTLQMLRYVPLARQRGGRVLLEVQPQLVSLLRSAGLADVLTRGGELPPFDVHVPMLNLPAAFGTTHHNMPRDVPYLSSDPSLRAAWHDKLARFDGFKVGICWQGNRAYATDRQRSISLRHFAPLAAVEGVRLFALQKYDGTEQLQEVAGQFDVYDFGGELDEQAGPFMDTAAVLENLDLLVTSDTATAHLAGALGVRTWLALTKLPEWRWFLDREDSPWYPTFRLFRQRERGDWPEVFARLAAELARLVHASHGGRGSVGKAVPRAD